MKNNELIINSIKKEGKEEFLEYDEDENILLSFDFSSSLISYSYKNKEGRIRTNIQCKLIIKNEDEFVSINHISPSTSIYKLLQITIDNAYKRTIYNLIKNGNDPLELQLEDSLIEEELKKDPYFHKMDLEITSLLLSNFEILDAQLSKKNKNTNKGKKYLIAYIIIYLILAIAVVSAIIWFYKYYLEGILSSSGL